MTDKVHRPQDIGGDIYPISLGFHLIEKIYDKPIEVLPDIMGSKIFSGFVSAEQFFVS